MPCVPPRPTRRCSPRWSGPTPPQGQPAVHAAPAQARRRQRSAMAGRPAAGPAATQQPGGGTGAATGRQRGIVSGRARAGAALCNVRRGKLRSVLNRSKWRLMWPQTPSHSTSTEASVRRYQTLWPRISRCSRPWRVSSARWRETLAMLHPHNAASSPTVCSPSPSHCSNCRRMGSPSTRKYAATWPSAASGSWSRRSRDGRWNRLHLKRAKGLINLLTI